QESVHQAIPFLGAEFNMLLCHCKSECVLRDLPEVGVFAHRDAKPVVFKLTAPPRSTDSSAFARKEFLDERGYGPRIPHCETVEEQDLGLQIRNAPGAYRVGHRTENLNEHSAGCQTEQHSTIHLRCHSVLDAFERGELLLVATEESAFFEFGEGLAELFLRIHDNGAVPGD